MKMIPHPASEFLAEVPEESSFLRTGSETVDRDEQVRSEFSKVTLLAQHCSADSLACAWRHWVLASSDSLAAAHACRERMDRATAGAAEDQRRKGTEILVDNGRCHNW